MNNFNCYNVEPKKKLFFNKAIIRLLLDEYISYIIMCFMGIHGEYVITQFWQQPTGSKDVGMTSLEGEPSRTDSSLALQWLKRCGGYSYGHMNFNVTFSSLELLPVYHQDVYTWTDIK